jgi:hypothetical protein
MPTTPEGEFGTNHKTSFRFVKLPPCKHDRSYNTSVEIMTNSVLREGTLQRNMQPPSSEELAASIFKVEFYTLKMEAGHSSKMVVLIYTNQKTVIFTLHFYEMSVCILTLE